MSLSNIYPALSRGISDHILFAEMNETDYIGKMFHESDMDGAYEDFQTWEGVGLPIEHFPMQRVELDGIRPSFNYRILARSWTTGFAVSFEDERDDLYNLIHRFLPAQGGEIGRAYYALSQVLGAQFFGLYGFQSGTGVPFSPDGLSFGNTAHPYSKSNTAQTWSNTTSTAADLSVASAQMMRAAMRTQPAPSGTRFIPNKLARIMVHPNQEILAKQIFQNAGYEPFNANHNPNNILGGEGVEVVVNPYFQYSGTAGATSGFGGLASAAYNSVIGQGDTHYCMWKNRSALESFSRTDGTVMGTIVTFLKRFGFGMIDPRGTFFLRGL